MDNWRRNWGGWRRRRRSQFELHESVTKVGLHVSLLMLLQPRPIFSVFVPFYATSDSPFFFFFFFFPPLMKQATFFFFRMFEDLRDLSSEHLLLCLR